MLFFINTSLFNWKSFHKEPITRPFYEIYKKQNELWDSSNSSYDKYKYLSRSSTNNNCLFYTGVEKKCVEICNKNIEKIKISLSKYKILCSDNVLVKYTNVKLKFNNKDSGKSKRLLAILVEIILQDDFSTINCVSKIIEILFPIDYQNWH